METHDLIQGSPEWLQFRFDHDGASEIAAVLGLSKLTTRTELLRMKKTGITKEFSDWVQRNILDHGHAVEALARPLIEAIIGEDLYPVTCSMGRTSASCDGLTFDDRIAFEHKQWNAALAALVATGVVPDEHLPQCQQVLMVTGAEKLIFGVSDGSPHNLVYCEVFPDPEWFDRIKAGWAQFHIDLAEFVPLEIIAPVVAAPVQTLPSVSVRLQGSLTVISNLPEIGVALRAFIGNMVTKPSTDQEFADADAECKALKKVEDALEVGENAALAELTDVDSMRRAVADLRSLARATRLAREKLVAAEKENRRVQIVTEGVTSLREYIDSLNKRLGRAYMPNTTADFGAAIRGKKNLDNMQDAVNTLLANTKISANEVASGIQTNLTTLRELGKEHGFLFSDVSQIVLKAPDDLTALVKLRIADHKAAEAAKEEATRLRIQAEEQAKAEAAARTKLIAEQAEAERLKAIEEKRIDEAAAAELAAAKTQADGAALSPAAQVINEAEGAQRFAVTHPKATVVPMVRPTTYAARPAEAPTLKLGQIGERLGFSLTGEFLKNLGFEPAARDKSALLFHESDFTYICGELIDHINRIKTKQAA